MTEPRPVQQPSPRDLQVTRPADLDAAAVLRVAGGASVRLTAELLDGVAVRRAAVLTALADGPEVYGVSTGMGALSDTRLTPAEQADHSRRLMLARAVGAAPWLDREETRALVAVRLRTFLQGDAGVSAGLCAHLADLLNHDLVPSVPRTGSGAAGEILPLAHAWGHLAGVGPFAGVLEGLDGLEVPRLGAKEGIALLAGVPTATALALLRARDLERLVRQSIVVAAAQVVLLQVSRDPYDAAVARGDDDLAVVLARVRELAGPARTPPRHLQAPVSFRVVGPVLAHLVREARRLHETAERQLSTVTDSPAYLPGGGPDGGSRFLGTAGFHGLDLATGMDATRSGVVHAAGCGAARLHRMLDPAVSGLAAQLSADPGPQAGLTPVHKRVVAAVHDVAGWTASTGFPAETSDGQEDVQTFALEAAERLRLALDAAGTVLAGELLAVHQVRTLAPERLDGAHPLLVALLDEVAAVLPAGVADRPWGEDVEALRELLGRGWSNESAP